MGHLRSPPPPPPSAIIPVCSFIHSFPSHMLPTQRLVLLCWPGWGCQPFCPPSWVCNYIRPHLYQARGCPGDSVELSWHVWAIPVHQAGGLGPVFQPRDLIQSRTGRKEIRAPGKGAERQDRGKVVFNVTSRIVASAPEVLGLLAEVGGGWRKGHYLAKKEPVGEAVKSCPCCKFPGAAV